MIDDKNTNKPINENSLIKDLLSKINEVRTNPIKIANKLTQVMSYINKRDNTLREPRRQPIKLVEGIKAFEEAITFLKSFQNSGSLVIEESMSKISKERATEIELGKIDTINESRSKFEEKFKKIATFSEIEECSVKCELDSMKILVNLVVCDGDSERKNRKIILSDNFQFIGIGFYSEDINNNNNNDDITQNSRIVINLSKNWKLRTKTGLPVEISSPQRKRLSKLNNFKIDLDNASFSESKDKIAKRNIINEEDILAKCDKDFDDDIWAPNCISKNEEKQILDEGDKVKFIKKVSYIFKDGTEKTLFYSQTINI